MRRSGQHSANSYQPNRDCKEQGRGEEGQLVDWGGVKSWQRAGGRWQWALRKWAGRRALSVEYQESEGYALCAMRYAISAMRYALCVRHAV